MLTTKNIDKSILSPMMVQYVEIKEQYPDDIVLFRVGDFFEAYFEDAYYASQICSWTQTRKKIGKGDELEIPMAGTPHTTLDKNAQLLIDAGYRVVVVEQLEDPKEAKGRMVKRDVVAIMSGMNRDGEYLTEYLNNFVCVIYKNKDNFGLCFADVSTNEIHLTNVDSLDMILDEIAKYKPNEIVATREIGMLLDGQIKNKLRLKLIFTMDDNMFNFIDPLDKIISCFPIENVDEINYSSISELYALTALLNYIEYTQKTEFIFNKLPVCYDSHKFMSIDMYSRLNLELSENTSDRTRNGTLFAALDSCKTAMGSRMLKQWIDKPLQNKIEIENRLNGVKELVNNSDYLEELNSCMLGILDIARIIGRIKLNKAIPRDIVNLKNSLEKIPEIKKNLSNFNSSIFKDINSEMIQLDDLCFLLNRALLDDPSRDVQDGHVLKSGYNKELDTARDMISNSNKYIAEFEESERKKTGIKNLKVVNKNGRCAIEITKTYYDKVPEKYRIEKALKGSTRYVTDESEKLEKNLFSAIERSRAIEVELYEELKSVILEESSKILKVCDAISSLDVLCSFAINSINYNYICPEINTDGIIEILNGRHPTVERSIDNFVVNNARLDLTDNQFILITGPNMAGKSTYMRQVALITLMAHIGCFVPASSANISIVDKIFTRIGASDDINSGRSTYMVEMTEVKNILDGATEKSLILLDEVGRGTSTSDGMAIAQSVSEYIYNFIKCKTMFATHYHELISLENKLDKFKNFHMAVKKENGELEFVRKIQTGGLSESYGIDVAQLAGLPNIVISRAWEILDVIDGQRTQLIEESQNNDKNEIINKLKEIDPNELTPTSAYRILYELLEGIRSNNNVS